MERTEFFKRQKEILENLFSTEWFLEEKNKSHSAYLRWALCKEIIEQKGIVRFPEQKEELHKIGRILLDSCILVALTEGDIQHLKLGALNLYGDEAVQKKILSRIANQEQYEDLMVELYFGAWHKMQNHVVSPMEKEGLPDFRLEIPGISVPVFAECKHLWTTSRNKIRERIKTANKQIKKAIKESGAPSYGFVVLDVSTPVCAGQVEDDNLPDKLQEIINVVRSVLSGQKHRSVAAAIIVWDDYMIKGEPPDRTAVAFRRRYQCIPRKNLDLAMPEKLPLFQGYTIVYRLTWTPRRVKAIKNAQT